MGVNGVTPGFDKRGVTKKKIRSRAERKAWGYEKRLKEERGGELARLCWKELKKKDRRGKVESGWEKEKRRFF